MNKNIYDTDCCTWSPEGRIFQIEYAEEAVKLGTCVVGLRGEKFAVLLALRRTMSQLADYNDKVLKIDTHCLATFSGITADANVIVKSLRSECMNHEYVFESRSPIEKLVVKLSDRSQKNTQVSSKRPYGVGFLIAGADAKGPHIFETSPSGQYYEYHAQAFGSRCQSAKTYLEANVESIKTGDLEALLVHGLKAIVSTLSAEAKFSPSVFHVGYVGVGTDLTMLSENELQDLLTKHDIKPTHPQATSQTA